LQDYLALLGILLYIYIMKNNFIQKWKSQVKRGTLTLIVLKELEFNEFYGYELMESIKKKFAIEIAEGTLYPLMNRLKSENLVESKWVEQESGMPRKYYKITKNGTKILNQMLIYWDGLNQSLKENKYEI